MFPNTRQLCPRDEHLSRRSRLGWHRASLSETRGNESAFTRVFDALCPRVTAENGRALSQIERNTLLGSRLRPQTRIARPGPVAPSTSMDKLFDIGARIAFGLFIFAVLATAILM